jgi:4-hydroxy-tetrahydrodipicolinate reductase
MRHLTIALIGYGKMGKLIETIALERGHTIGFIGSSKNTDFNISEIAHCDVAIEFSLPHAAPINIKKCIDAKVPVAIGTTGWYDQLEEIKNYNKLNNGCILPTTNFSVGVNIFFALNKHLAKLMNQQPSYDVHLTEIHHTQKLDAPSGTAITTAEILLHELDRKSSWVCNESGQPEQLSIQAIREENVPGTHTVVYENEIDQLIITHEAKNRRGFAMGAILAAEFITDKKGVFAMQDVLGIENKPSNEH